MKHHGMHALLCVIALATAAPAFAQDSETATEVSAPVRKKKVEKTYPTVTIKGEVMDLATKQPLAGVQVQTLGNNRYTAMTDEDGKFAIKVPKFATALYVHSPEYLSQQIGINVNDTTETLSIRMISDAYGKMYDNTIGYTANKKVSVESHSITVDNDITKQLSGDLRAITRSGIAESGAAFFIRGLNSLNTNAQPLIIIDGVEQDMQLDRTALHDGQFINILANISPDDIESVEVVKNATALYGSRGGNGVILISTKRGHSMATRIDASIYAGVSLIPSLPNMMNADQYRTYSTEMLGTIPAVQNYTGALSFNYLNHDPSNYYYHTFHNNTDWSKNAYRNAVTQNYSINVQGGDAVGMYNLSVGYAKAQNTAKENDFDRMNIRFNTDIEILPVLKTIFDLSISRTTANVFDTAIPADLSQGTVVSPTFLSLIKAPIVSPYDYDAIHGQYSNVLSSYDNIFESLNKVQSGLGTAQSLANPVSILDKGKGDNKNRAETTYFNVKVAPYWQITKSLKISETFSYNLVRNSQRYFRPTTGVPSFTIADLGGVSSKVASFQSKENTILSNTRIDWEHIYGSHNIKVFGGFRFMRFGYDCSNLSSEYKATADKDDKNPTLSVSDDSYQKTDGASDVWKQIQWYANADYNYQNRYFATVSLLAEANSRFGKNAGTKIAGVSWAFFPSVQLGWVISNERWFKQNRAVNHLQLNLGFDTSGNDGISNYAARTAYSSVRYNQNIIGSQLTNIGNDKIKWELTKKLNVGLRANFVDNRISLGIDYYNHWTTNLLTLKTFENPIGGINNYWTNGGALKNEGVEVTFTCKPVVHKHWHLELGATLGHYKNKVTSLPDGNFTSSIYGDNNILTAVGGPVGQFYGYQTAGVFASDDEAARWGKSHINIDGNETTNLYMEDAAGLKRDFQGGDVHFVDQNGDGVINSKDKVVIGNPNPDIYGRFFANLNWKGLTLDANFTFSLGNDVYNYQRSILNAGSNFYNQQVAEIDHWRYEGQQTSLPRLSYGDPLGNNRFSDRWIEDGSYLRLKALTLSYKIPVPVSWTWLQGLTVWGEARNVFTVSKYLGSDPESSINNGVLYQGIDAGNLYQGRSFLFGLKINL